MCPEWIRPNHSLPLDFQLDRDDQGIIRERACIKRNDTFILPVFLIIAYVEGRGILIERAAHIGIFPRFEDPTVVSAYRLKTYRNCVRSRRIDRIYLTAGEVPVACSCAPQRLTLRIHDTVIVDYVKPDGS